MSGPEAINAIESENVLVQNCKLWDELNQNGGAGVLTSLRSNNVTYRNNEVHSPFIGPILHHDQSRDVTYENNIVVGLCNKSPNGTGYYILDEPYPERKDYAGPWRKQYSQNITIRNNLIIGVNGRGIVLGGCQKKAGEGPGGPNWMEGDCIAKNFLVENNTVIGVKGTSLTYSSGYNLDPQNLIIRNNIFHSIGENTTSGSVKEQYLAGNIWSGVPFGKKSEKDLVIPKLSGVFSSGINPETCINSLDLTKYKTTQTYSEKGADIDKVGIKADLPPISKKSNPDGNKIAAPTQTPKATTITAPKPTSTVSPKPEGNKCGSSDVNGDGRLTLIDFSEFAKKYKIGNTKCNDTREEYISYGKCGGKDVDRSGVLDINDFGGYIREGGYNIGFARRYFPKESCELPKEWHESIKNKP